MTLATSQVSAPRPKSSRRRRMARSSSGMARLRKGCSARLGETALTRTPAGLGRGVVALARLGPPPQDRGVVDDDAAAPGEEVGQRGPGAAEGAGERDV